MYIILATAQNTSMKKIVKTLAVGALMVPVALGTQACLLDEKDDKKNENGYYNGNGYENGDQSMLSYLKFREQRGAIANSNDPGPRPFYPINNVSVNGDTVTVNVSNATTEVTMDIGDLLYRNNVNYTNSALTGGRQHITYTGLKFEARTIPTEGQPGAFADFTSSLNKYSNGYFSGLGNGNDAYFIVGSPGVTRDNTDPQNPVFTFAPGAHSRTLEYRITLTDYKTLQFYVTINRASV